MLHDGISKVVRNIQNVAVQPFDGVDNLRICARIVYAQPALGSLRLLHKLRVVRRQLVHFLMEASQTIFIVAFRSAELCLDACAVRLRLPLLPLQLTRVRFVEPLPSGLQLEKEKGWKEFEKIGEVVDEMRRLGRETFVVEMGIGSTK